MLQNRPNSRRESPSRPLIKFSAAALTALSMGCQSPSLNLWQPKSFHACPSATQTHCDAVGYSHAAMPQPAPIPSTAVPSADVDCPPVVVGDASQLLGGEGLSEPVPLIQDVNQWSGANEVNVAPLPVDVAPLEPELVAPRPENTDIPQSDPMPRETAIEL